MCSTACRLPCAFGWWTEGHPGNRPADSSGCGVSHGASSGRLGLAARCLPFAWRRAWRRSTACRLPCAFGWWTEGAFPDSDPPILRVAASPAGLPPVALGRSRGVFPSPGGERGDVPPLDACAPPPAPSAAPSGGGLRGRQLACFPSRRCRSHRRAFRWTGRLKKWMPSLCERVVIHIFAVVFSLRKRQVAHALLRAQLRETLFHSFVSP